MMYKSYASVLVGTSSYRYYVIHSTMKRQIQYGTTTNYDHHHMYHQHHSIQKCFCYYYSYNNTILNAPTCKYNKSRSFVTITNTTNSSNDNDIDTTNIKTIHADDVGTTVPSMTKSITTETESTTTTTSISSNNSNKKNKRQRHQFHNNNNNNKKLLLDIENIPSYHDFQRQIQIRTLYRKYTKLIGLYSNNNKNKNIQNNNNNTSAVVVVLSQSQKIELQQQVRQEFRYQQSTNHQNDIHYIQMAYSEGQRRYKELYNMIYNTTADNSNNNNNNTFIPSSNNSSSSETSKRPPSATDHVWPWNQPKQQQEDIKIESLDTATNNSSVTTTTANDTINNDNTTSISNQSISSFHPMKFPPKSNLK